LAPRSMMRLSRPTVRSRDLGSGHRMYGMSRIGMDRSVQTNYAATCSSIRNPKSEIRNPKSCRPGQALITAIMVLLILVGLIAALAPVVRVNVRAAADEGEALQARYLARAGV